MAAYIHGSVAPSTRQSYDTAVQSFRDYCSERGWLPDAPITTDHALEWLAALADRGRLCANSIRAYKSALRTQAAEERRPGDASPNPLDDELVGRLLTGITNAKAEREQQARRAKRPDPLPFQLVQKLRDAHDAQQPRSCMLYAALSLAVAGGFRPSELFGSSRYPERALQAEQVVFYADVSGDVPIPSSEPAQGRQPLCCIVSLRIAKNDPRRRGRNKLISAPTAVLALWQWMRLSGLQGSAVLFQRDGVRLTGGALAGHARRSLARIGHSQLHITPKSFRRGGASTLAAAGVTADDIAKLGWAPGSRVWESHYANDPQVQRARAFAISRQMGEAVAAAASGAAAGSAAAAISRRA